MNKRIIVIHHNDGDGRMAAAVLKVLMQHINVELIFVEAHDYYNTDQYIKLVEAGDIVYILDFSLEFKTMDRLIALIGLKNIFWIDHHETVINKYKEEYPNTFQGLQYFNEETPLAGCELTWEFLHKVSPFVNCELPKSVELLGAYDTWRYEDMDESYQREVLAFTFGTRERSTVDSYTSLLVNSKKYFGSGNSILSIAEIEMCGAMEKGYAIVDYLKATRESALKRYGYEATFEGLNVFCLNTTEKSSLAFQEKIRQYDACISYCLDNKNMISASIYTHKSTGIYANQIAARHGGGGHRGAAGFTVTSDEFTNLVSINL